MVLKNLCDSSMISRSLLVLGGSGEIKVIVGIIRGGCPLLQWLEL